MLQAASQRAVVIPASAVKAAPAKGLQTAVLAGGCFWGMEAVFEHVRGVKSVQSGYAGGTAATAKYEVVASEKTRHAEAIKIVYDAGQVSYEQLLRIYFAVAHDPTQLNRQGPDVGASYRSAVFPQSAEQRRIAASYIAQLGKTGAFKKPIVTRIEGGRFFPAEAYHQDFMRKNPTHPYIVAHDVPKLAAFKRAFGGAYQQVAAR